MNRKQKPDAASWFHHHSHCPFQSQNQIETQKKNLQEKIPERAMGVVVESLRYSTIVLSAANMAILILGGCLAIVGSSACGDYATLPFAGVMVAAAARIVVMINIGIAQDASAKTILQSQDKYAADAVIRHERRLRYIKWIWWTRIASVITLLQFVGAIYLLAHIYQAALQNETGSNCLLGIVSKDSRLEQDVLIVFVTMVSFVAITQCFAGSDVLRWRSFYASEDNAWRAHYREVFDVGMREALCCLGRVKYWSVLEEDEVYSVARVLGDLVAYRASGTGHLELLTGLALFQRCDSSSTCNESLGEAPRGRVEEAAALHKFAEAAYTGPLLDVGRNPLLFPCVWLYRQGILTPWSRNRRPKLKGDNWWRGHAAAFLKYLDLPPETLRKGRICQGRCEAAYFIVALHYLRTVVITVRGTETPEDLITDGLCKECPLLLEDLDGLIKSNNISLSARQAIESSFPHYGHSGIVEAARDLFSQIEGNPEDGSKDVECTSGGFLSSLLGPGGECEGYSLRIVGHSLGGAIASMLGLRLYHRYPNLHVYAYGSLPSVDSAVADACSEFITSIIYDNEFSARLSVGSVLRLRAASLTALSQDQKTDSALIPKLARQFLLLNKFQANRIQTRDPVSKFGSEATMPGQYRQYSNDSQDAMEQGKDLLSNDTVANGTIITIDENNLTSHLNHDKSEIGSSFDDPVSRFMETVPTTENASVFYPPELFLPGLIVHIVPQKNEFTTPVWRSWKFQETPESFKVYIANKDNFKDLVVSPSMFLDHLPWRCRYALDKIVANQRSNLRSV